MSRPAEGQLERYDAEWQAVVGSIAAARSPRVPGDEPSIGVTVLTGFLGAGKTTILRRLLEGAHGLRLGVIVNDVGGLNVDAELVASVSPDRVDLSNGCACCALVDDLATTLGELVADEAHDALVIEASGAADPIALAQAASGVSGCRLDGVVAVVDAVAVRDQQSDPRVAHLLRRQIEAAHVVVLSKTDLVPDRVDELMGFVSQIAPGRMIVPSRDGAVDPRILLGAAERGLSLPPSRGAEPFPVFTLTVDPAGPWTEHRVAGWAESEGGRVLRSKGWFVDELGRMRELQTVGGRWSIRDATASGPDRHPAIVLIGLDEAELAEAAARLEAG